MKTSSNQITENEPERGAKKRSAEDKYILKEDFFFKIEMIDGEKSDLSARLIDISKFGGKIELENELPVNSVRGATLEGYIYNDDFRYSVRLKGIFIWKRIVEGKHVYGIQYDHPVNILLLSSIFEASEKILGFLHEARKERAPDGRVIALIFQVKKWLGKILPEVNLLENNWNLYGARPRDQEEIINLVYNKMRPALNFIRDETNKLLYALDERDLELNFNYIRKEMLEILMLDPLLNRSLTKPLGYAGDFEMMQSIYRNRSEGTNLLGKSLHKWTLTLDSCKAVQNRRVYFYELIKSQLESGEKLRVLSIACGPAQEIVSLVNNTPQEILDRAEIYLLDQDKRAINEAKHSIRVALLRNQKKLRVRYLGVELGRFMVKPKNYISEPLNLIYSAGLFDYIKKSGAQKIVSKLYSVLSNKGEMYIGNFSDESSDAGFMKVVDWELLYRSDEEILDFGGKVEGAHEKKVIEYIRPQKYFHLKKTE